MSQRLYTAAEVTAIFLRLAQVERDDIAPKAGSRSKPSETCLANADALESYAENWPVWMPEELRPAERHASDTSARRLARTGSL